MYVEKEAQTQSSLGKNGNIEKLNVFEGIEPQLRHLEPVGHDRWLIQGRRNTATVAREEARVELDIHGQAIIATKGHRGVREGAEPGVRGFTRSQRSLAPPNKRNFSVKVVLPASGCEMIAKVLRRAISGGSAGRFEELSNMFARIGRGIGLGKTSSGVRWPRKIQY